MKWILLIASVVLMAGCCCTTTDVIAYRQVTVTPVVEPIVYTYPQQPLDVTTTTIDFY